MAIALMGRADLQGQIEDNAGDGGRCGRLGAGAAVARAVPALCIAEGDFVLLL